jgi:dTDP-glucose pyrophosphorylase
MDRNLRKVTISPESTLRDALSILESEGLRIVLVVDSDFKLLGIVTDGDIRRGLLTGLDMQDIVSSIMNTNPTTVTPIQSKKDLIMIMEKEDLLALPVIEKGYLINLVTLHDLSVVKQYDNPVFLMAGGFGTRLRPLTNNCPKPLLKVGDKAILETTLLHFISHGFSDFYISTHYLPEMIREYFGNGDKWGVSITYVHESDPLGTGGALGLLPKNITQLPLIMMNGDVLTNMDLSKLLEFHINENSSATMCVREYEYKVPYGVVQSQGTSIISMIEKPTHYFHVNAGIYVVSPEVFNTVDKNSVIDMPTLLEECISENKKVSMFQLHEYWLDIGRMEDYERAQIDIKSLDFV